MTRYLSIGTYPRYPRSQGGRLRLDAMHRRLTEAGWNTRHIWIGPYEADAASDDDIAITYPRVLLRELQASGRRPDLAASRWLLSDYPAWQRFVTAVQSFDPDVIAVEQAMAWPAVRRLLETNRLRSSVVLVYSSHNVEQALVGCETDLLNCPARSDDLREITEMENSLAAEADLVIAVSESDASFFRASNLAVCIAGNGVWPRMTRPGGAGGLFVSSAHPPNAAGFAALCGPWLRRGRPRRPLTVAGGVCDLLNREFADAVAAGTLVLRGKLSDAELSHALDDASFLVLPITHGGGTNIKTAEALCTGKPVIATTIALRGFETFRDLAGLHVADDAAEFTRLLEALSHRAPTPWRSPEQRARTRALTWPHTMAALPEWLARPNRFGWAPPPAGAVLPGRTRFREDRGWQPDALGKPRQIAPEAWLDWPGTPQPTRLSLTLSAMGDITAPQTLTIEVPGRAAIRLRFEFPGQRHTVSVLLPPAATEHHLRLTCTPLHTYNEISASPDRRSFGVTIETIGAYDQAGA